MKTSNELPENTVIVYVQGGLVQWAARGPGRRIDLIVMDHDTDSKDEYAIWHERCAEGVVFDEEISKALDEHFKEEA